MAMLNEREVNIINDQLVSYGLSDDMIRLDLIDHVCTLTELFMEKGQSFEAASKMAFAEFKPQEFEEIQELSLYYINLKQNKMKKAVGILGIATSLMIVVGVGFKLEHWPGANITITMGLLITSFILLPLMAYVSYNKTNSSQAKFTHFSGYLAAVLNCVAFIFIMQHWPGARALSILGMVILCLVFMPLYAIKSYKTSENKILGLSKSFLILAGIILFWGLLHKPHKDSKPVPEQHSMQIHKAHDSFLQINPPITFRIK